MTRRLLTSPAALGTTVREARREARLSQAELARRAGVGRRLVVDVEAGHPRAELGKVLALLDALDVFLVAGEVSPIAHRLEDPDRGSSGRNGRLRAPKRTVSSRTTPPGRILHAFAGRRPVGHFRVEDGQVRFAYDPSAGPTPVSLTLPRHGEHQDGAALAYLDRLLPGRADLRQRWARERGLTGVDPLTLLASYGEDLVGALSLSPDPELPWRDPPRLAEATRDDIAARIAALRNQPTAWLDQRARPRLSLPGRSAKFTLARLGGRWFWPTYETPSTHLFKVVPDPAAVVRRLDEARRAGTLTARAEAMTFLGQQVLVLQRWDRRDGLRIHAERLPDGSHVLLAGDRVTPAPLG